MLEFPFLTFQISIDQHFDVFLIRNLYENANSSLNLLKCHQFLSSLFFP